MIDLILKWSYLLTVIPFIVGVGLALFAVIINYICDQLYIMRPRWLLFPAMLSAGVLFVVMIAGLITFGATRLIGQALIEIPTLAPL